MSNCTLLKSLRYKIGTLDIHSSSPCSEAERRLMYHCHLYQTTWLKMMHNYDKWLMMVLRCLNIVCIHFCLITATESKGFRWQAVVTSPCVARRAICSGREMRQWINMVYGYVISLQRYIITGFSSGQQAWQICFCLIWRLCILISMSHKYLSWWPVKWEGPSHFASVYSKLLERGGHITKKRGWGKQ